MASGATLFLLASLTGCHHGEKRDALTMVVMDPLAKELACACVGGYAQRDYLKLAEFLRVQLNRPVEVVFADGLDKAVRQAGSRRLALVVGKESVVQSDARLSGMSLRPLCRLTDKAGLTTLTGLFVVRAPDPAKSVADLAGQRILFGPADSAEKHSAALAMLIESGVTPPATLETRGGCSDAALDVQEADASNALAAVISSYALPLLEGCESIERGSLRVVGETRPVPFVTVFASAALSPETTAQIQTALQEVRNDPELLRVMDSLAGFVPWTNDDWPDWRGAKRDGLAAALPKKLTAEPKVLWRRPAFSQSLAGLAATSEIVLLAERDPLDQRDVFRCLRAADGETRWTFDYAAEGRMDYGHSPRATPVIQNDHVFLLGAFGQLHCVSRDDGKVVWRRHLVADLGGRLPGWGYCSTPLIVDDLLIINPGGKRASLVALNRQNGDVVWKTSGNEAAFGSFIVGEFGGRRQIIGYDAISLGGWDCLSGKRLWTLTPSKSGDFNVPTPIALEGRLLVATENNGARLYGFRKTGVIEPTPLAVNDQLSPETCSPVVANQRVFGTGSSLVCLNLAKGLSTAWSSEGDEFGTHASLIATEQRLLVLTFNGELLLLDTTKPELEVISRLRVAPQDSEIYAHPALAGGRLYLRDATSVLCLALD
jgi:ABC-type phosphate/phosphonate transport system substrate-binding protein/outer membrane protein assembly factor BamB